MSLARCGPGIWQLASCVFFTGNYTVSGGCWVIINIFLPTYLSDPGIIPLVTPCNIRCNEAHILANIFLVSNKDSD